MSTPAAAPLVGVVIPFFQRRPGLLRRAVASVAAQMGLEGRPVRVIVVDDASPSPPAADLDGAALPSGVEVETLAKPNGGPGSARNAGIVRASALGCRYVAFLDSDDWWEPDHLATALAALENGAPFFFGNSMHDDVPSFSYFDAMSARGAAGAGTIGGEHVFGLLLRECFPHTSQVVYALAPLADVRFDETMQRTGEDHLFWLTVAAKRVPFAWSGRVLGHRGSGVSVYRSALGWDAAGYLERLLDAYRFRSAVAERFRLSASDAATNARFRQEAADEIAYAFARSLGRSPRRAAAMLATLVREGSRPLAAVLSALPRLRSIRRRVGAA